MEGLSYWESTVVGQKYRDKTTLGSQFVKKTIETVVAKGVKFTVTVVNNSF